MVILFGAWSRSIEIKRHISGPAGTRDWMAYRLLMLVCFLYSIALIIVALINLPRTFAYLAAIYIVILSITFFYGMSLFRSLGEKESSTSTIETETE